jgi:MFS transporter, DHA2 family, methylenomycin A resistance protein
MQLTESRPDQASSVRWLVLTVMCVGYFLVLLDVTVVNVALPEIGRGLGSSAADLQWVVDGYSLALAAFLLTGSTLGDRYGHKLVVLIGLALFAVASLGCGVAPSIVALVAARAVQGLGAALLLPGTLAIITWSFAERAEQARAIGIWAGVGSLALPAGPLLGGALVLGLGWRWVFIVNLPIAVLSGMVAIRVVPEQRPSRRGGLDVAGVLLGALTLGCLTFAVIQAGRSGITVSVMVMAGTALASTALFVRAERRSRCPMLPLPLLRRPAFTSANGVAGVMNFGTLGLLFLLTLFLQVLQHRSALAAGIAVLPLFLPLAVLAPLGGRLTARHGARRVMMAGLLLAALGVALATTWTTGTRYPALFAGMLVWGIGLALLTPAVVAAAVAAVPAARAGLASGMNNTARQAGGALGIATYGAIAGQPDHVDRFLAGMHVSAIITCALFVAASVVAAVVTQNNPPHQQELAGRPA